MNKYFAFGIFAVLLGVCSSSSLEAGQFGVFLPGGAVTREANDNRANRVCVYENSRYEGWEQCYTVGQSVADLNGRNRKISSIRVYGRAAVTVYEETNFHGADLRLADDISDLRTRTMTRPGSSRTWDNAIQSLRVDEERGAGGGGRSGPREPREGICVYENVQYKGRSECWSAGESVSDLARIRSDWNNRISSVRIFGRGTADLYGQAQFRGEHLLVDRDIPDLSKIQLQVNQGRGRGRGRGQDPRLTWNDQVSSIRVESRGGRR